MNLRVVEPDEFKEIQRLHVQWLASDGKAGRRADLRNVILREQPYGDLRKANIRGARISITEPSLRPDPNGYSQGADLLNAPVEQSNLGANFADADLSEVTWIAAPLKNANLTGTKFVGANLCRADFSGADLTGANLNDACLRDANLENTHGLLARALRGADVGNAKLPKPIETFEGLKIVDAFSQNAAKVFILLLVGCAYAWLTVATTSDADLITSAGTSKWPIIQTEVPIVWFFLFAPVVLFCIYIYLHLYLQRLWESLADLPAIFPDGRPLDRRTYPWLMNDLVRDDFALLRGNQPALSSIQRWVSIFLCWWIMPLTLLVFWVRYLPRHDSYGTAVHVLLFGLTAWAGSLFYSLARATLRGERGRINAGKHLRKHLGPRVALTAVAALGATSYGAIRGDCHYNQSGDPYFDLPDRKDFVGRILPSKSSVPKLLNFLHCSAFADLTSRDISTKPTTWTGLDARSSRELPQVKGVQLQRRDLRFTKGEGAFFANMSAQNAQFTGAYLKGANCYNARVASADFSNARLENANLRGADLSRSSLTKAHLEGADLRNANLDSADLRGAYLYGAKAQGAKMDVADFSGAHLDGADLRGASLFGATISKAQVGSAITDSETRLPLFPADTAPPSQPSDSANTTRQ